MQASSKATRGAFPRVEVIRQQEGAGHDHGREQATEQLHEEPFAAVDTVAQVELGEGGDADEEEGQGDLNRVVGGVEVRSGGQVVGGELSGEGNRWTRTGSGRIR